MREETQLISFFEISFFLPNKTILHAKFQTHRSENIGTGHTIDGHLDRQSFFNIRMVISNNTHPGARFCQLTQATVSFVAHINAKYKPRESKITMNKNLREDHI